MDEKTREAASLYSKLNEGDQFSVMSYIIVVAVMDKLNGPELNRMNEEFQQQLNDPDFTREEHLEAVRRMFDKVKELTAHDKTPLFGCLSR